MKLRRSARIALPLLGLVAIMLWAASIALSQTTSSISGRVVNESDHPVPGARVRIKTTANMVLSDQSGSFVLSGLTEGASVVVTAWQENYLVSFAVSTPPADGIVIRLRKHYATDNPDYPWLSSSGPIDQIGCCPLYGRISAVDRGRARPVRDESSLLLLL